MSNRKAKQKPLSPLCALATAGGGEGTSDRRSGGTFSDIEGPRIGLKGNGKKAKFCLLFMDKTRHICILKKFEELEMEAPSLQSQSWLFLG